jgi:hypothetical protein
MICRIIFIVNEIFSQQRPQIFSSRISLPLPLAASNASPSSSTSVWQSAAD